MHRSAKWGAALVILKAIVPPQGAAEVLFNGQWENYLGHFYGADGWENGTPVGQPTGTDHWSEFTAFWSPAPLDNTWLVNTSWAPDRIRLEEDPTSPKHGYVARIEVRPEDHPPGKYGSERAEMLNMLGKNHQKLPVTTSSGHEFYAISIKLSPDWRAPQYVGHNMWGTFMQLHSPNVFDSPPALDLMADTSFHLNMDAGDLDKIIPDWHTGKPRHVRNDSLPIAFSNGDLRLGHWVQFILDVVWSTKTDGAIRIYRRDERETAFSEVLDKQHTPTLQTDSAVDMDPTRCPRCSADNIVHYWRVGFYRSASPNQTNVLWLGPIARATSFDEAEMAAFGTHEATKVNSP